MLLPIICLVVPTMIYQEAPLMIPVLATGYVLTVYLLLMIAKRTAKISRSRS